MLPVWGNFGSGLALAIFGFAAATLLARWFPHPRYTGCALACFGVAMMAQSRAGLWLYSPVVALAFAAALPKWPHLLPEDSDEPPDLDDRIRYWFTCALLWVALYELTAHLRLPGRAFQFGFEDRLPVYPSTSLLYQSTYAAVTFAPWFARTKRDLRRLIVSAWVATALVFPFYWLAPSTAPRRPMEVDGALARLLAFERNTNPPSVAFPSFHVLWSIFIARLARRPWLGWTYALGVSASCITTGMHYIPDVLVSFAIAPWLMEPRRLFRSVPSLVSMAVALLAVVLATMAIQQASAWQVGGVATIGAGIVILAAGRRWLGLPLVVAGLAITPV